MKFVITNQEDGLFDENNPIRIEDLEKINDLEVPKVKDLFPVSIGEGEAEWRPLPRRRLKEVLIQSKDQLLGTLRSDTLYVIDGDIALNQGECIVVPESGLNIMGYSFDASRIGSYGVPNHSIFCSSPGGSGNLIIHNIAFTCTGEGSKVFDIWDSNGSHALEMVTVNFEGCKSVGRLDGYRQATGITIGMYGCGNGFILDGAWNGFKLTNTNAFGFGSNASMFKAGENLTFRNRFYLEINIDIPNTSNVSDVSDGNFLDDKLFQVNTTLAKSGGVIDPETNTPLLFPNISPKSPKALFVGNIGIVNTPDEPYGIRTLNMVVASDDADAIAKGVEPKATYVDSKTGFFKTVEVGTGSTVEPPPTVEDSVSYYDTKLDFPIPGEVDHLYVNNYDGSTWIWDAVTGDYIKDGQTQVQSDWEEVDPKSAAYIRNKPDSGELPFVTRWNIPAGYTLDLFINTAYYTNIIVDWGDGTIDKEVSHTYTDAGIYDIQIKGRIGNWTTHGSLHKDKLLEIVHWGDIQWEWINFNGCSNLTTLPVNSVPDLNNVINLGAFLKGTSVSTIPADLLSKTTSLLHLGTAFSYSKITEIPAGLLDNATNLISCEGTFYNTPSMTTIPANLFRNNSKMVSLESMFNGADILGIPANFLDGLSNLRNIKALFRGCSRIPYVPNDFLKYNIHLDTCSQAFYGCSGITAVPLDFGNTLIQPTDFGQCFMGCHLNTEVPELWLKYPDAYAHDCFITPEILNWADIPENWGGTRIEPYSQKPIDKRAYWDTATGKAVWRIGREWKEAGTTETGGTSEQVQSDWAETNTTALSYIKSKPTLNLANWDAAYTHSTTAHAPANAQQNVQSDWNAVSGDAFIKNKPSNFTVDAAGFVPSPGYTGYDRVLHSDGSWASISGLKRKLTTPEASDITLGGITDRIHTSEASNLDTLGYPIASGALTTISKYGDGRGILQFLVPTFSTSPYNEGKALYRTGSGDGFSEWQILGSKPSKAITILPGETYTLVAEDMRYWLRFNVNNGAATVVVPYGVFKTDEEIEGHMYGSGSIVFQGAENCVVNKPSELSTEVGSWGVFGLKVLGLSSSILFGTLKPN